MKPPQTWHRTRHLRLASLMLLLVVSTGLYYHQTKQQQQNQQRQAELQQQLTQHTQQLQQLRQQQQQLQQDLPRFAQLPLIEQPRLNWLEQLSQLQQHYPLQFQLAAQQLLPLPAKQLLLHFNPLQLQLSLQHEQQLLDLLAELHRDPWFRLRHCQLQRQPDPHAPLLIDCHGGWLTLSTTEAKT